jgi:hypothetical protein
MNRTSQICGTITKKNVTLSILRVSKVEEKEGRTKKRVGLK